MQPTKLIQRLLQPGQGFSLAHLQQSGQHVLHSLKQVLSPRLPYSSSASKPVEPQYRHLELQTAAVRDIAQLLPAKTFEQTPKGCRANLSFSLGSGLHLPLQAKAGQIDGNRVTFTVRWDSEKGVVPLLLCRPYPSLGKTLVATPCMVSRERFNVTLTADTKYYPLFVPDSQLSNVVTGIYEAVKQGTRQTTLPSGKVLDISELELKSFADICLPSAPSLIRAREFHMLRGHWLPVLDMPPPSELYTPVNAVLQGVRICDAVARHVVLVLGKYQISTPSRWVNGRKEPMHEGEYDVLWVYHPDKVHFWLIPAHVLAQKGFLATAQQRGKFTLLTYDHSYIKPQRGKGADLWTQQYLLSSRDPGLMEKVMQVLKAAKPSP